MVNITAQNYPVLYRALYLLFQDSGAITVPDSFCTTRYTDAQCSAANVTLTQICTDLQNRWGGGNYTEIHHRADFTQLLDVLLFASDWLEIAHSDAGKQLASDILQSQFENVDF